MPFLFEAKALIFHPSSPAISLSFFQKSQVGLELGIVSVIDLETSQSSWVTKQASNYQVSRPSVKIYHELTQ
jgi:hypothetical protein